jgi:heme/copper-type cytochrome/quinol oxidase subunit 3
MPLRGSCCVLVASHVKALKAKMSNVPENNDGVRKQPDSDGVGDTVKFALSFAGLVGLMYYVWNFVGPSGQTMSLGSFIAFFFRELILVGFFGLLLIVGCVVWLTRIVRNLSLRGGDAL